MGVGTVQATEQEEIGEVQNSKQERRKRKRKEPKPIETSGTIIERSALKNLLTCTQMINSDVITVYLGLLVDKCCGSKARHGVGATSFAFVEILKQPTWSWEEAQRHKKDHPVNLIPIHIGGCHWVAVIVDSTLSSGRKFLYFDSMSYFRESGFNDVKDWFHDWEDDSSKFVMMDWQEQAVASNDCAVRSCSMCLLCAA